MLPYPNKRSQDIPHLNDNSKPTIALMLDTPKKTEILEKDSVVDVTNSLSLMKVTSKHTNGGDAQETGCCGGDQDTRFVCLSHLVT